MCSLKLTRAGRDQQLLYPCALPSTKSHVKSMSGQVCFETMLSLGGETRGPSEFVLSRRALGQKQLFCKSFILSKLIYG